MNEKILTEATLCFVRRGAEVLLARKARHIGAHLYNGYGGGPEPGESFEEAAVRELQEESGISALPEDICKIAVADFHNPLSGGKAFTCRVHVYQVWKWQGEPRQTEEMYDLAWFDIRELPFEAMMPADFFWLPNALLARKKVLSVQVWYGPGQKYLAKPVELSELVLF